MTAPTIKCVVWDLDDTVWDGTLLEDDHVALRPGVVDTIRQLDERGILHSVASRNEMDSAMARLEAFGIADLFLVPQISWGAKSASIKRIAELLNVGMDTLAFVDDQPFERAEVEDAHPAVLCLDATDAERLPHMERFQPRFVTDDSRARRSMYRAELKRVDASEGLTSEQFLSSLDMVMTITEAVENDLDRIEELTIRTNQLNSTGLVYSHDELVALCESPDHLLLVAGLEDRFGSYGKVGLALVAKEPEWWRLRLLLMSCRVMSRGVGKVLLTHVLQLASAAGKPVQAEFIRTPRNRPMYMTFKFSGFSEVSRQGDHVVVQHDLETIDPIPSYVEVRT